MLTYVKEFYIYPLSHVNWTKYGHGTGHFSTTKFGTTKNLVFTPGAIFRGIMVFRIYFTCMTGVRSLFLCNTGCSEFYGNDFSLIIFMFNLMMFSVSSVWWPLCPVFFEQP